MIDFEWRARQLSIWVGAAPEHEARLAKALRQLAADVLTDAADACYDHDSAVILRTRATAIKDGKQ
jgi:hypothetical protein